MNFFIHRFFRVLALLSSAAIAAAACSGGGNLTKARTLVAAGDLQAAIIELKSYMQSNGDSADARLLMGEALLKSGAPEAAAIELQKALDLKADSNMVTPLLARSLYSSGQFKKVLDAFSDVVLPDQRADSALKWAVASSLVASGRSNEAIMQVDAAWNSDPKNVDVGVLRARLIAGRQAFDDALRLTDDLLAIDAKRPEPLVLKGDILWLAKGDLDGAAKYFRRALSVDGGFMHAHVSLIKLLLEKQDVEGMKAQVAALKKVHPSKAETVFFDAQVAYSEKNFVRARELGQTLLLRTPDNPFVLHLVGASDFNIGNLGSAEANLNRAVNQLPALSAARRLLARTQVRQAQPAKALLTLKPLVETERPEAEDLALAASAYLQMGDTVQSEKYYKLATKANPSDPQAQTALALAQIARGQDSSGFERLEKLTNTDSGTYADLALISARMTKGDAEGALKSIDHLQAKATSSGLPGYLRGLVEEKRGDTKAARIAYTSALSIEAAHLPSLVALANLDLVEGNNADAKARYEAILVKDPGNLQALIALAELRSRAGAKPEAILQDIEQAIRLNPNVASARIAQVQYLLSLRRAKAAVEAAQQAMAVFPDNSGVLDVLGTAQLAAGDTQQALNTLKKSVALQPTNIQPMLRLAEAAVVLKNNRLAEQTLNRVLELSPRLIIAQRGLIKLAVLERRMTVALQISRKIQKAQPSDPIGFILESEVHSAERNWAQAVEAFQQAVRRDPSSPMAQRMHILYVAAGDSAGADRLAQDWLNAHPKDAEFQFHLGNIAMARDDYGVAEVRFRAVVELQAENSAAFNNLAWVLVKQGKADAVAFAERANRLLPNRPEIIDTLAAALAADKRWPQAVEAQRRVVELAAAVPAYRLSLAKYLISAGDRNAARPHLAQLATLGTSFKGHTEVKMLLDAN